jgi:SpoVK/Ycf46/Vps4 family AAA+-type ATPase
VVGFFVGQPHYAPGSESQVIGFINFSKSTPENFRFSDIIHSIGNISTADSGIIVDVFNTNFGASTVPFIEIILWCFATYVVVYLLADEEGKIPQKKWALFSSISASFIFVGVIGSYLIFKYPVDVGILILLILVYPIVFGATAFSFLIRDSFEEYFKGRAGVKIIGTRIAEMPTLGETTFEQVGGLLDVKTDLRESIVVPLLKPDLAKQFGIEPPRGIMLFGPPGCGKTLLMKALATELNIEMITVKCSDIMSKWYGESESKIAELFKIAKERKPCILFLDELDAIAKRRDMYAADDVTPRLLSIMLSELDGMDIASGIIVVGSTNKPELVDPALLRPGRFDKILYVPPPDYDERVEIFKIHLEGRPVGEIDLHSLAKKSERFSGADIANVVKEAASIAMKRMMASKRPDKIQMHDLDKILAKAKPSITYRMIEDYEKLKMDYERKLIEVKAEKKEIITFANVGGLDDAKDTIRECVELMKKPDIIEQFKLAPKKGMLLFGPPGCGKTYLVKAIEHEFGVYTQIVYAPELVHTVHTEDMIKDIFHRGKENAPSIIFFDDVDALISESSMKSPEVKRAVTQLLTEIDGLKPTDRVMVIVATNEIDVINAPLFRPGRLDTKIYIPLPGTKDRFEIFKTHLRDVPTSTINFQILSQKTRGYTCADIHYVINEAKLMALRAGNTKLNMKHLMDAIKHSKPSLKSDILKKYVKALK